MLERGDVPVYPTPQGLIRAMAILGAQGERIHKTGREDFTVELT
jgi:hypothetical protein